MKSSRGESVEVAAEEAALAMGFAAASRAKRTCGRETEECMDTGLGELTCHEEVEEVHG